MGSREGSREGYPSVPRAVHFVNTPALTGHPRHYPFGKEEDRLRRGPICPHPGRCRGVVV